MADIITVIVAAAIGYLFKSLENFKNDKAKSKAYKIILTMDFEQNLSILSEHVLSENPFKDIKYKLWNKNNIAFAQYVPKEAVLYGQWLAECKALIRGVEKWDDPQECIDYMVKYGHELLKSIKS